ANATALIEPLSNATSIESLLTASSSTSKIDTEVQLITSATNMQTALDKLDLSKYKNPDGIAYSELEKPLKGSSFKNSITVSTVSNTKIVKIKVQDGNAQFAADYTNAILESYGELLTGISKNSKSAQREFIEAQIPITEGLLNDASIALSNFKEQSGITQMTEKASLLTKKIASLQLMIDPLKLQVLESESIITTLSSSDLPTYESFSTNDSLATLLTDYKANSKEMFMYQNTTDGSVSSRYYVLESSLASKAKDVLNAVTSIVGQNNALYAKAVADKLCVNATIDAIEEMVSGYEEELSAYPLLERQFLEYQRDVEIYEALLLSLREMLEQTKMVEAAVVGNITVIDAAMVPEIPVSPKKLMILAVAVVGGVVIGILFGFMLEFLDSSIRDEETVHNILGGDVPSLGWTPYIKNVDKVEKDFPSLFVLNDFESSIAERFCSIANNIAYSLPKKLQVLSINSCEMGEGKTTAVCNVAAAYAIAGKKVLLIDGDYRKPAIENFFNLKHYKYGIVDTVINDVPLEQCIIRPTEAIPNLHIISTGRGTKNPNALYNSEKFSLVIEKLRLIYDYIFIDCPPLTYGSEFTHLAKHLDGYVLHIRAGVTTKSSLVELSKNLSFISAPLLGFIYYGVISKNQSHYGKGYGYGYGYTYGRNSYSYGNKYGYRYGYDKNHKPLYVEGTGSYSRIYANELKKRETNSVGTRIPVLAFANGSELAFVTKTEELKNEDVSLESEGNEKKTAEQITSDMLSDIEEIFKKEK
ncbi:MAG: polysaccharide biosynthesis tyrosine autokinase, partial [Sphaerochaetaceae bacterium]|nr:polysaccharide biosynthesis tyrosine autokinase [Sphaerochaetaceae bacterium]